ncbi:hypothetical protein COP2_031105 [Malus domestica]
MAISPVKAHLKDSLASTIHTSVQGFVSPLRNTETTKLAVPFPLADQHVSDSINLAEYGVYRSFNSRDYMPLYAALNAYEHHEAST